MAFVYAALAPILSGSLTSKQIPRGNFSLRTRPSHWTFCLGNSFIAVCLCCGHSIYTSTECRGGLGATLIRFNMTWQLTLNENLFI